MRYKIEELDKYFEDEIWSDVRDKFGLKEGYDERIKLLIRAGFLLGVNCAERGMEMEARHV